MQGIAEDSQEDDGCDHTLECEEVLNLCVWDTEEWNLQQEIQQETDHPSSSDTFIQWNVIRNVRKAWPDRCEKNGHTLAAGGCLNSVKSK